MLAAAPSVLLRRILGGGAGAPHAHPPLCVAAGDVGLGYANVVAVVWLRLSSPFGPTPIFTLDTLIMRMTSCVERCDTSALPAPYQKTFEALPRLLPARLSSETIEP